MELGTVSRRAAIAIAATDLTMVCISVAVALVIQFGLDIPDPVSMAVLGTAPALIAMAGVIYWVFGLHRSYSRPLAESFTLIVLASLALSVLTMAFAYGTRFYAYPRRVVVSSAALQVLLLTASRVVCRWWRRNGVTKRVLLVSDDSTDDHVATEFAMFSGNGCRLIAMCRSQELLSDPDLGETVDVLCIGQSVPRDSAELLVRWAQEAGKDVYLVPRFLDTLLSRSSVGQIGDVPLFRLERLGLSSTEAAIKRLGDVALAAIGLVLTLPLFPLVAAAIIIDSGRPVFYLQERVGQYGRVFKVIKFRTMVSDAERDTGPVMATVNDHRITRVGRVLRACRLDELPQLVNILLGHMSCVGPRPERPVFVERFCQDTPLYAHRHVVKPGLTGLAQISANYSTSAESKLRYDLMYISHYSPFLDLQILAQTAATLVSPRRAQGVDVSGQTMDEWVRSLRETWKNAAAARDERRLA